MFILLLCFLDPTVGRIIAKLSEGGGIRWPLTLPSFPTWFRPAVPWPENQISWPSCGWLLPIWKRCGVSCIFSIIYRTSHLVYLSVEMGKRWFGWDCHRLVGGQRFDSRYQWKVVVLKFFHVKIFNYDEKYTLNFSILCLGKNYRYQKSVKKFFYFFSFKLKG